MYLMKIFTCREHDKVNEMKTPPNYRIQKIDGCNNCKHRLEDFELYCYLTTESLETLEKGKSFVSLFGIDERGICDNWEKES